jgi:hypothetical protein
MLIGSLSRGALVAFLVAMESVDKAVAEVQGGAAIHGPKVSLMLMGIQQARRLTPILVAGMEETVRSH